MSNNNKIWYSLNLLNNHYSGISKEVITTIERFLRSRLWKPNSSCDHLGWFFIERKRTTKDCSLTEKRLKNLTSLWPTEGVQNFVQLKCEDLLKGILLITQEILVCHFFIENYAKCNLTFHSQAGLRRNCCPESLTSLPVSWKVTSGFLPY